MTLVDELNARIQTTRTEVHATRFWRALADPDADPQYARAFLRGLFRDIASYQWFTTRAGFAMIGSLPAARRRLMRSLLLHKWEEVEHRQWAHDGYVALGGQEPFLDSRANPLSPTAASVASVWEWMADHLDPVAYLGAEYLFEKLTAVLSADVAPLLRSKGLTGPGVRFIRDHVEEDAKHAKIFDRLIRREVRTDPAAAQHIRHGFETFREVYPLPVWNRLYDRAAAEVDATPAPEVRDAAIAS